MTYRPPGLMAGLLLSACALVLGLSLAAAGRRDAPKLSAGRARDSMRARLAGATRGTSSREASEPPFPRSEGAE
jgi:hypothetical protein